MRVRDLSKPAVLVALSVCAATARSQQPQATRGDQAKVPQVSFYVPIVPTSDDPELLQQVVKDIELHPRILQSGLSVSVVKIENGYVTLTVDSGHPELPHWLHVVPERVKSALSDRAPVGKLFADPRTRGVERQQVTDLFDLARAIAKNARVKGVYWVELDRQRQSCLICNPYRELQKEGPGRPDGPDRPQVMFYIHYPLPGVLNADAFAEFLQSFEIEVGMPHREKAVIQFVRLAQPQRRRDQKFVFGEIPLGDATRIYLPIRLGALGYAESRAILEQAGLWRDGVWKQEVVHVYPSTLKDRMVARWQEEARQREAADPRLRGRSVHDAHFGFTHDSSSPGKWSMRVQDLVYR